MKRNQTIRSAIFKHRGFVSFDQIVEETGYSRAIVRQVLDLLCKEGLIRETDGRGSASRPGLYRINQTDERETLASNRMWKVMRYKREFTLRDLMILAEAKRDNAKSFLKSLRRAGIIAPNKPTGRGVYWRLIKDPGPKRPYTGDQKKGLRTKDQKNGLRFSEKKD